jgi:hypothetical protein
MTNENDIIKSASKIVLLAFAFTACVAFLAVALLNAKTDAVVVAVVAMFSGSTSSVLTYYFSKRSEKSGERNA